jgi:hypothetical protein
MFKPSRQLFLKDKNIEWGGGGAWNGSSERMLCDITDFLAATTTVPPSQGYFTTTTYNFYLLPLSKISHRGIMPRTIDE